MPTAPIPKVFDRREIGRILVIEDATNAIHLVYFVTLPDGDEWRRVGDNAPWFIGDDLSAMNYLRKNGLVLACPFLRQQIVLHHLALYHLV